jgi:hypothetical protein
MFAGALLMWTGVPVAWLWLGSQLSSESQQPKGLVYVLVLIGIVTSMFGAAWLLGRLNRLYYVLMGRVPNASVGPRWRRSISSSRDRGSLDPLAVVMVVSVVIAVVAALVWFGFFAECPEAACSSRP